MAFVCLFVSRSLFYVVYMFINVICLFASGYMFALAEEVFVNDFSYFSTQTIHGGHVWFIIGHRYHTNM